MSVKIRLDFLLKIFIFTCCTCVGMSLLDTAAFGNESNPNWIQPNVLHKELDCDNYYSHVTDLFNKANSTGLKADWSAFGKASERLTKCDRLRFSAYRWAAQGHRRALDFESVLDVAEQMEQEVYRTRKDSAEASRTMQHAYLATYALDLDEKGVSVLMRARELANRANPEAWTRTLNDLMHIDRTLAHALTTLSRYNESFVILKDLMSLAAHRKDEVSEYEYARLNESFAFITVSYHSHHVSNLLGEPNLSKATADSIKQSLKIANTFYSSGETTEDVANRRALILSRKARLATLEGQTQKAQTLADRAMELSRDLNYSWGLMDAHLTLSRLRAAEGDYDGALQILDTASAQLENWPVEIKGLFITQSEFIRALVHQKRGSWAHMAMSMARMAVEDKDLAKSFIRSNIIGGLSQDSLPVGSSVVLLALAVGLVAMRRRVANGLGLTGSRLTTGRVETDDSADSGVPRPLALTTSSALNVTVRMAPDRPPAASLADLLFGSAPAVESPPSDPSVPPPDAAPSRDAVPSPTPESSSSRLPTGPSTSTDVSTLADAIARVAGALPLDEPDCGAALCRTVVAVGPGRDGDVQIRLIESMPLPPDTLQDTRGVTLYEAAHSAARRVLEQSSPPADSDGTTSSSRDLFLLVCRRGEAFACLSLPPDEEAQRESG